MVANMKKKPIEFDKLWVSNAFAHVVWKLSGFCRFLIGDSSEIQTIKRYLSPQNILFHVQKKFDKEFTRGKQSFFQRVVQGDDQISQHFVGILSSAKFDYDNGDLLLEISDGSYVLKSKIKAPGLDDKIVTCESQIYRFVKIGKLFVG